MGFLQKPVSMYLRQRIRASLTNSCTRELKEKTLESFRPNRERSNRNWLSRRAWISLAVAAILISPTQPLPGSHSIAHAEDTVLMPVATDLVEPDCNTIWQRPDEGFYESNPTYTDLHDDTSDWQFATPESQGLNSTTLNTGVTNLAKNPSLLSVLIIRHGKLVYEQYSNGGAVNKSNNINSASKSILQALIGIAVKRGAISSLDDPVSKYLPRYFTHASSMKKSITLRNLLDMSSGLNWTEDQTENKIQKRSDWVAAILDRTMWYTPGTTFNYSSGNTHILSAVLQAATGVSTCQYAETYLFSKIGITPEHWGRDPQEIYSGGYNLYMTPREMAKFGLLYLNNGVWKAEQIVPTEAITQARTKSFQVDATFAYSQGWWMRTISGHTMLFGWGYGGQFLYVIPDLDIVFATTENTSDGFSNVEINSGDFIQNYLIPAITGP